MTDDPAVACRKQSIALLARREHSRLELERKLVAKAHERDLVAATLDDLEAEGLLDNTRYAESYVRLRAEKGYGPRRIRLELGERGVPGALAAEVLEGAGIDWAANAAAARAKRFGDPPPDDFAERARQARFLDYRGFGHDDIERALDRAHESD